MVRPLSGWGLIVCKRTHTIERSFYFSEFEEIQMAYSIDLSGRVAFVTGASSGLAQFARTLARAGAGVVVLASRRIESSRSCAPASKARAATPMWWSWT